MKRLRITIICVGLAATLARGASITLPPQAVVHGAEFTLGEIAQCDGTPEEMTKLQAVVIGPTPAIGQERTLTQGMITVRLRASGVKSDTVTFTGAETITVSRVSTQLDGATLRTAAQEWLNGQLTAREGEEIVLTPSRAPANLTLPEGTPAWTCTEMGSPSPTATSRFVLLTVTVDGKEHWRGVLTFKVQRFASALVAKTTIARGAALTPELYTAQRCEISGLREPLLRDGDALRGQRAKRTLLAGAVLTTTALEPIPLVCRNQEVRVQAICGALIVSSIAIAGEDGILDAVIRVRNPQTRQDYAARVVGPGLLELAL